MEQII
jgi:hypothetical protein